MNQRSLPKDLFCALALLLALARGATDSFAQIPSADLFTNGSVRRLEITIPPEGIAELRTNARQYVIAQVREGTNTFAKVGIHLKGSIGSFRGIDAKPALTLSFDKAAAEQRFYGTGTRYP